MKDILVGKTSSRKFWIFVIVEVFVSSMLYLGKFPPDIWANFTTWFYAAYVVGNGAEHFKEVLKKPPGA